MSKIKKASPAFSRNSATQQIHNSIFIDNRKYLSNLKCSQIDKILANSKPSHKNIGLFEAGSIFAFFITYVFDWRGVTFEERFDVEAQNVETQNVEKKYWKCRIRLTPPDNSRRG
jgi:hypothetical protein